MIDRVLRQFGRHMDILLLFVSSVFFAGVAWSSVSTSLQSLDTRVTHHDTELVELRRDTQAIRETVARIDERTDAILRWTKKRND